MKTLYSFILFFALLFCSSQEITNKKAFAKCRKEFSKKTCLSDEDNDSVIFYLDECPKVFGIAANNGCPLADTDDDGVIDKDDACVDIIGPSENNGCPWPDTDGDSILDKDDACPTVAGIPEKQGCPEKDCEKLQIQDSLDFIKFKTINKEINIKYLSLGKLIIENLKNKKNVEFIYIHFPQSAYCYYVPNSYKQPCSSNLSSNINLFLTFNIFTKSFFEEISKKSERPIMTSKFVLEDFETMQNEIQMDLKTYDYYKSNYDANSLALRIKGKRKNRGNGRIEMEILFVEQNPFNVIVDLRESKLNFQYINNKWKLSETK
uniref:hypothetical protein n=1 Tax=Chryseobacterium ginsenosidimutans TaxID=687846 RepID=UPI003593E73D